MCYILWNELIAPSARRKKWHCLQDPFVAEKVVQFLYFTIFSFTTDCFLFLGLQTEEVFLSISCRPIVIALFVITLQINDFFRKTYMFLCKFKSKVLHRELRRVMAMVRRQASFVPRINGGVTEHITLEKKYIWTNLLTRDWTENILTDLLKCV